MVHLKNNHELNLSGYCKECRRPNSLWPKNKLF